MQTARGADVPTDALKSSSSIAASVCSRTPRRSLAPAAPPTSSCSALSLLGLLVVGVAAEPEPGYSDRADRTARVAARWRSTACGGSSPTSRWCGRSRSSSIAFVRGRRAIARDMVLAVVVGDRRLAAARTHGHGRWPSMQRLARMSPTRRRSSPQHGSRFPGAAIIAASPHLVRPARRFGRWLLVLGSIATISSQISSLFGVIAGMLCAAAAAAIVHLIVGSSAGRPSLDDVRYALADLGVRHHRARRRRPPGCRPVRRRRDRHRRRAS